MPFVNDTAHAFLPYPEVAVPQAGTGPLTGLTFAVKDLFDVAGYPTGGGNPFVLARSGIKSRTAATVQRLLDAGARFVGKVVTDEFAYSLNGNNAHFGAPINGAAPLRVTGGSSSGSASAVSSRLADFALGTDTGGSVRAPANHCGLFGIRPTHGRISLEGCMDLSPSFDTCGFFARDVATFARVADVLLGDDSAPLPASVRLLHPEDVWQLLEPEVAAAFTEPCAAIERAIGAAVPTAVALDDFDTMYANFRFLQGREAWASHGGLIEHYAIPLGPGVAERFAAGREVTDAQVAGAVAFRKRFRVHLTALLGGDGVLLMPTLPDIAPLRTENEASLDRFRHAAFRILCIAGLAGFPQVSMPLARRLDAPLGVSLLGPAGSDRGLIALAERLG